MIKALKGTPQEDNRVLSDPYNWGSLYPVSTSPRPPLVANFVRPFSVSRFLPFRCRRRRRRPLETYKLKGVS